MISAHALVQLLESHTYGIDCEDTFQRDTEQVLLEAGVPFVREYRFDKHSRVDFLVYGQIALELKIKGSGTAIARQLMRYAQFQQVCEMVLFTTRAKLCRLPSEMFGKPLHVAYYPGAF